MDVSVARIETFPLLYDTKPADSCHWCFVRNLSHSIWAICASVFACRQSTLDVLRLEAHLGPTQLVCALPTDATISVCKSKCLASSQVERLSVRGPVHAMCAPGHCAQWTARAEILHNTICVSTIERGVKFCWCGAGVSAAHMRQHVHDVFISPQDIPLGRQHRDSANHVVTILMSASHPLPKAIIKAIFVETKLIHLREQSHSMRVRNPVRLGCTVKSRHIDTQTHIEIERPMPFSN